MSYDNGKNYTWSNEEIFTFSVSGREFGLILNTLRALLSTEQAAQILLADRAMPILEKMMAQGVEEGKIVEIAPNKE
jgi:hypothetical protein